MAPIADAPYERENWQQQSSSGVRQQNTESDVGALDMIAADVGLRQHLHSQINVLPLDPRDHALACAIVESLDDDGYLRVGLEDLAATSGMTPAVEASRDADRAQARAVARPARHRRAQRRRVPDAAAAGDRRRRRARARPRDHRRPPRSPGAARRPGPRPPAQANAARRSRRRASASATSARGRAGTSSRRRPSSSPPT